MGKFNNDERGSGPPRDRGAPRGRGGKFGGGGRNSPCSSNKYPTPYQERYQSECFDFTWQNNRKYFTLVIDNNYHKEEIVE